MPIGFGGGSGRLRARETFQARVRGRDCADRAPVLAGHPLRERHVSKIFDAVNSAQQKKAANAANAPAPPKAERRRCPRRNARVTVVVQGLDSEDQRFQEEACSANVSELGGLLEMDAAVLPGQVLLLTNKITQEEQGCRVAYVGGRDSHRAGVGVEFANLAPDFWRT